MLERDEAVRVTQEFEVTTEELLRTLQRRGIPLPSEIGAFITLEVCEHLLPRPARISTRDVSINEVGEVLCASKLAAASEPDAVSALLALLGDLLVCAAPGVPNMLLDLVEHGPNEEQRSLQRLLSDLEACLLPLNRGATRRVLSRLVREVQKPGPSLRAASPVPAAADVDAAFDALLGDAPLPQRAAPAPAPPTAARSVPRATFGGEEAPNRPAPQVPVLTGTSSLKLTVLTPAAAATPDAPAITFAEAPLTEPTRPLPRLSRRTVTQPMAAAPDPPPRAAELQQPSATIADERDPTLPRAAAPEPQPAPEPRRRPVSARAKSPVDFDQMVEAQAQRGRLGLWVFAISTVAALGLLVTYFALGRDHARSALGLLPRSESQPQAAQAPAKEKRLYGDLRVSSDPPQAQVLLLIGKGPALATDIPLGVAQEFVALSPGFAPARALLPSDAQWDELDGQPRYELAMQAKSLAEAKRSETALGATMLPHSVGTPTGRLGSVRVVTTPRGAKVYQLIGFTPDVRVENLPLDRGYEVLVYLEGRALVTRPIEPADFHEQSGKRVAALELELPKATSR